MKEYILETQRLSLRKLTEKDAEYLFALRSNENVIRYTSDVAFSSVEEARQLIVNYDQYTYRLGRWAVELKDTKEFIGWCGLKFNLGSGDVDLSFRFFEEQWNKGFATEAAYACIVYAFDVLRLMEIIGRPEKTNKAAERVLQKLGMCPVQEPDSETPNEAVYVTRKFQFKRIGLYKVSIL